MLKFRSQLQPLVYLYSYLYHFNWSHPIQWVPTRFNLFVAVWKPALTIWLMYFYIYNHSFGHIQCMGLNWSYPIGLAGFSLFVAVQKPALGTWLMYIYMYIYLIFIQLVKSKAWVSIGHIQYVMPDLTFLL